MIDRNKAESGPSSDQLIDSTRHRSTMGGLVHRMAGCMGPTDQSVCTRTPPHTHQHPSLRCRHLSDKEEGVGVIETWRSVRPHALLRSTRTRPPHPQTRQGGGRCCACAVPLLWSCRVVFGVVVGYWYTHKKHVSEQASRSVHVCVQTGGSAGG